MCIMRKIVFTTDVQRSELIFGLHGFYSNGTHDLLSGQKISKYLYFSRKYSIAMSMFWWVMAQRKLRRTFSMQIPIV